MRELRSRDEAIDLGLDAWSRTNRWRELQGNLSLEQCRAAKPHASYAREASRFLKSTAKRARRFRGTRLDEMVAALALAGVMQYGDPKGNHESRVAIATKLIERGHRAEEVLELLHRVLGYYIRAGRPVWDVTRLIEHAIDHGQLNRIRVAREFFDRREAEVETAAAVADLFAGLGNALRRKDDPIEPRREVWRYFALARQIGLAQAPPQRKLA